MTWEIDANGFLYEQCDECERLVCQCEGVKEK